MKTDSRKNLTRRFLSKYVDTAIIQSYKNATGVDIYQELEKLEMTNDSLRFKNQLWIAGNCIYVAVAIVSLIAVVYIIISLTKTNTNWWTILIVPTSMATTLFELLLAINILLSGAYEKANSARNIIQHKIDDFLDLLEIFEVYSTNRYGHIVTPSIMLDKDEVHRVLINLACDKLRAEKTFADLNLKASREKNPLFATELQINEAKNTEGHAKARLTKAIEKLRDIELHEIPANQSNNLFREAERMSKSQTPVNPVDGE